MTLTEFLAARLGEAEKRAGYVHDVARDAEPLGGTGHCDCGHPARVLREVEAGRKILALHQAEPGQHPDFCGYDLHELPCLTLRLLAAIWSDHPDYHESWRPLT